MSVEEPPRVKICVLGNNIKLNQEIIRMISDEVFETDYLEVQGVDICTKDIIHNSSDIRLILVIISGNERFENVRSSYYHGARGFVVFFDKGDIKSFETVPHWVREFQENIKVQSHGFIIGIDTQNEEITSDQGKRLAEQLSCIYAESTPTDKTQITDILCSLVNQIYR